MGEGGGEGALMDGTVFDGSGLGSSDGSQV